MIFQATVTKLEELFISWSYTVGANLYFKQCSSKTKITLKLII